jgi:two-component system, sensor histidine kinase and response regulator
MTRNDQKPAQEGDSSASYKGDILLVDDRADNLRLLSTMLAEQGYKVRKVIKGELTIEVVQVNPPDLILLDILMPKINGFEVCQQLKADPLTQAIPVIFISALDEPLDKVKAFAVGGTDYITKPFEIQEVAARIEHQLHIVRLQKQLQDQNKQLHVEVAERQKAEITIQRINEELEERVDQRTAELTQANRQLQQLGQKLQASLAQEQKLSQLKSHLITTISHEYRTPMAVISSSTGILEEYLDKLTSEQRRKHFVRIQAAIQRMTDLIDDVFFLNQLEFENYQLDLNKVDLSEITGEIIAEIKSSTHISHDIQFTVASTGWQK